MPRRAGRRRRARPRWPSRPKPMSTAALEAVVDVRRTRLELLLKVLDVDGAVRRVSGGWSSTGAAGPTTSERYARVAAARDAEAASMLDYQRHRRLPDGVPAGGARRPAAPPTAVAATAAPAPGTTPRSPTARCRRPPARCARSACRSSRGRSGPAACRRLGVARSGRIAADERVEQGRVVARLTDLGWGQRLRALLAGRRPGRARRRPAAGGLRRGARRLGLGRSGRSPSSRCRRCAGRSSSTSVAAPPRRARAGCRPRRARRSPPTEPTGGPGGNSAFRLAAVHDRFAVPAATSADGCRAWTGPVLLVDDLVDSRWTDHRGGRACCGGPARPAVLPFALAAAA